MALARRCPWPLPAAASPTGGIVPTGRRLHRLANAPVQARGLLSRLASRFSDAPGPLRQGHVVARSAEGKLGPRITVFGMGGTIAGSAAGPEQTAGYKSGVLSVEGLLKTLPVTRKQARLKSKQIVNVGSPDLTGADLLRVAQTVNQELEGDTQGVVITHGTDTMEETAFFLDLTVKSHKPVVLVGAMRPATALGADGPMNLLCAVNLAASADARGRGVMIVLNDRICSARFTTKTNANSLDSFKAEDQGYLGMFVGGRPDFYYPPCRPLHHRHFDVTGRDARDGLPKVDILYGHLDMNPALFQTAAETSEGVVLAAMGGGSWATRAGEAVAKVVRARDYPVVVSRRVASGFVGGAANHGLGDSCIGGGLLDASRCRIQLQLALATGLGRRAIRGVFEGGGTGRGRRGRRTTSAARLRGRGCAVRRKRRTKVTMTRETTKRVTTTKEGTTKEETTTTITTRTETATAAGGKREVLRGQTKARRGLMRSPRKTTQVVGRRRAK